MNRYVLDACALLALLRNEPGADEVAAVFNSANKGEAKIVMHKANLLEVYYDVYRFLGMGKADFILSEVLNVSFACFSTRNAGFRVNIAAN